MDNCGVMLPDGYGWTCPVKEAMEKGKENYDDNN